MSRKRKILTRIYHEKIKYHSGCYLNRYGHIQPLRQGFFKEIDLNLSISGEAPKCFISIYEYGKGIRKSHVKTWPKYIAKVGIKSYPIESITEHLINRIGQVFGFRMAESQLVMAQNQIRFLSRYFLQNNDQLEHGAQIISGLVNDSDYINEIIEHRLERELFTFQIIEKAINRRYPDESKSILEDFVKMLTFDSLIGSNDRHAYNWGVITNVYNKYSPYFSPIFDSARGLFWNTTENDLNKFILDGNKLKAYLRRSSPQIGWENENNLNHFELLSKIYINYPSYSRLIKECILNSNIENVELLINDEFSKLLTIKRRKLILTCLELRLSKCYELINKDGFK